MPVATASFTVSHCTSGRSSTDTSGVGTGSTSPALGRPSILPRGSKSLRLGSAARSSHPAISPFTALTGCCLSGNSSSPALVRRRRSSGSKSPMPETRNRCLRLLLIFFKALPPLPPFLLGRSSPFLSVLATHGNDALSMARGRICLLSDVNLMRGTKCIYRCMPTEYGTILGAPPKHFPPRPRQNHGVSFPPLAPSSILTGGLLLGSIPAWVS